MRKEQLLIPLVRQLAKRPALAEAMFRFDPWGNPFSEAMVIDPMTMAPAMRKTGPVYWHRLYQQWFITGYDEAREILASPHVGTANQVEVLLDVTPYTKLSPRSRAFFQNLMLLTDPPQHTRQRGLVNRAFTPRQVNRLESMITSMVDELLANIDLDGEVEVMEQFGFPLPAMVIAELFGFQRSDWRWLRETSATVAAMVDPFRSFEVDDIDRAVDGLYDRVLALAAARRAEPTDDLITGLALAEADGDRLSEDELVSVAGLILFAGHETTASMIGLSVMMLRERPDQLALLRTQPDLWPGAVEELLRFDPAVRTDPRTVLEDFEFGSHQFKKGQNIAVLPQMTNRDLRRFPDADELKVDREDPAPLTFGHGIHYCLGANLARAELRLSLPPLLNALDGHVVDPARITWRESIALRGPTRFPVAPAS